MFLRLKLSEVFCASLCFLFLQTLPASASITMESVDYPIVPRGEKITLTGSGLGDTKSVTFIFNAFSNFEVDFTAINDQTLEFSVPSGSGFRFFDRWEHYLIVETETGSAVSMGGADVVEFTETGSYEGPQFGALVVKSGAVLTDFPGLFLFRPIYVESGAVLQAIPDQPDALIFAEDGATLDFSNFDFSGFDFLEDESPRIFVSPETEIIGQIPPADGEEGIVVREMTSISRSSTVGRMIGGFRVNTTVVGGGQVAFSPDQPFFEKGTDVTVTAIPGEGSIFQGWSGPTSTLQNPYQFNILEDVDLTATFSGGGELELTRYAGGLGSISAQPESDSYSPGQEVTLTATPIPGYIFEGWGGEASGQSNPLTMTLNESKTVTAIFRPELDQPTVIESVDHTLTAVGDDFTVSGTGLGDPTAAWFFFFFRDEAALGASTDTDLSIEFPVRHGRDLTLVVETLNGSTVTIPGSEEYGVTEFSGHGSATDNRGTIFIQKAGSVVTEFVSFDLLPFVYLETGAVMKDLPGVPIIFAEDGATIDLSESTALEEGGFEIPPVFYVSPKTEIIGDLPPPENGGPRIVRMTSIRASRNIGPFSEGFRLDVDVVGDGSVEVSPAEPYYRSGSRVQLTAVSTDGSLFQGWSGNSNSLESTIEVTFSERNLSVTANFLNGATLQTFSGGLGTIAATPDLDIYSNNEEVSLTATPIAGYEFVRWGGDAAGETPNTSLVMDEPRVVTAVFRPVAGTPVSIDSVDLTALPAGESLTVSGMGLQGTSRIAFHHGFLPSEAGFVQRSDSEVGVVFPELTFDTGEHILVLEAEAGSTVTLPEVGSDRLRTFTGNGTLIDQPGSDTLLVQGGAVLSELSDPFRPYNSIYVESGGVLQAIPDFGFLHIFAEDGATLDFERMDFSNLEPPVFVYLSPATEIIGSSSTQDEAVVTVINTKSFSPSYGIGPFTQACQLDVEIEGAGSVTLNPDQPFYRRGDLVEVTAEPSDGSFFIRWAGLDSSLSESITVEITNSCFLRARFDERPGFFNIWRPEFFLPAELADPAISGTQVDPDGDGFTNAAEYAFGTNPREADGDQGFSILPEEENADSIVITYRRPVTAADVNYRLQLSEDLGIWHEGDSAVLPFGVRETDLTPVGDGIEEVTLKVTLGEEVEGNRIFAQITADLD